MKPSFLNINRTNCDDVIKAFGQPSFRSKQLTDWIYLHKQNDLTKMSNLPKAMVAKLDETYDWSLPKTIDKLDSQDGTTKLLLQAADGRVIETVIMRYENRTSLCVSSQVGCKLACTFCQTGKLGFFRHLSREEILSQYFAAQQLLSEEDRRISHVVFMGMGEPFDNYDAAIGAVNTLIDPDGFGLSARHVTLSTSGIVPKIERLAVDSRAALAVSLHAATDELRTKLMPINKKYPLAMLKEALVNYQKNTGRKVTIEYLLLKNENCNLTQAKALVKFLHGLRCKVNLIPFNDHPGSGFERPGPDEIRQFQKHLSDRSYPAPVRYSKGLDVSAACGQLAAKRKENLTDRPLRSEYANLANTIH